MRLLVKQCPRCGGIIKVQVNASGEIVHIENAVQGILYNFRKTGLVKSASDRTIRCMNPRPPTPWNACGRHLQVRAFKEIVL